MSDSKIKAKAVAAISGKDTELTLIQRVGTLLMFATLAWSIYVNVGALATFFVMLGDMIAGSCNTSTAQYLANSFIWGLGSIPIFVAAVILRSGIPYAKRGSATKWGIVGLLTSVLSAPFWYVAVIVAAAFV